MVITDYLIDKMIQQNIITEDKELYIYGLNNGFILFVNFITALFLSYIVHKTDLLLFLLITFIPLRSYCGGIHCKSRSLCYIYSNVIITVLLLIQNFLCNIIYIYMTITILCFLFLFITKTYGNKVRVLEDSEITHYTHIKRLFLCIIMFGSIILFFLHQPVYATTMITSINLAAILVILEKIKIAIQNKIN